MVTSVQFKKWNGIVGGFCLGLWVSARYWRQIRDSLAVWGIDRNEWLGFLLAVAGACGISLSVALSMEKKRREVKKEIEAKP
jgi:hypothetical protein